MSTASEHRAWRGNRPPSVGRHSVPQSRSSIVSPPASGASTPIPAPAKQDNSKPLATTKPVEQTAGQQRQTPAPAPSGNVWDQRKVAAQQARTTGAAAAAGDVKPVPAHHKKTHTAASAAASAPASEASHVPVNGFNSAQVRNFLAADSSSFKAYRPSAAGSTKTTPGAKGTTANGQSLFAQLSKQIAQLQVS